LTPTTTPTPSASIDSPKPIYVYSACSGAQNVLGLDVQVPGVTIGQTFKYGGRCWNYVGQFNQPYSPPSGTIYATSSTNILGSPTTIYESCELCEAVPIPSVSPTPSTSKPTVCYSYSVQNTARINSITVSYTNCFGKAETLNINPQISSLLCSTTMPVLTYDPTNNGVITGGQIACF
jgi:hypothetical protein